MGNMDEQKNKLGAKIKVDRNSLWGKKSDVAQTEHGQTFIKSYVGPVPLSDSIVWICATIWITNPPKSEQWIWRLWFNLPWQQESP